MIRQLQTFMLAGNSAAVFRRCRDYRPNIDASVVRKGAACHDI